MLREEHDGEKRMRTTTTTTYGGKDAESFFGNLRFQEMPASSRSFLSEKDRGGVSSLVSQ